MKKSNRNDQGHATFIRSVVQGMLHYQDIGSNARETRSKNRISCSKKRKSLDVLQDTKGDLVAVVGHSLKKIQRKCKCTRRVLRSSQTNEDGKALQGCPHEGSDSEGNAILYGGPGGQDGFEKSYKRCWVCYNTNTAESRKSMTSWYCSACQKPCCISLRKGYDGTLRSCWNELHQNKDLKRKVADRKFKIPFTYEH